MQIKTLQEAVTESTQAKVAKQIGVNQSAVSQMLRSGRKVLVRVDSLGRIDSAWEWRPLGVKKAGLKESA